MSRAALVVAVVVWGCSSDGGGGAAAPHTGTGDGGALDAAPAGDAAQPPRTQAVIAHRGASGHAPEHTFAAYDLGIEMGADYIEQDVALSSDGVLVCLHDDTLDRTARGDPANCSGSVVTKTLAQLKTCDVGSWFNEANPALAKPEFVGLKIPTLEEVFQRYGARAAYYIETKIVPNAAPMEAELFRLIDSHGLRNAAVNRRQVLIQSFSSDSLVRMRELDTELPLVQLSPIVPDATGLDALAAHAFGVGPSVQTVTANFVENAHARGLAVHPYTVNSGADLERVGRLCVDGMFTNFPDRYRALVDAGAFACPPSVR